MPSKLTRKRILQDSFAMQLESSNVIRAGKWTLEEEELASKLIYDFEIGNLSDCKEGTTLRWYLSKKLSCAPMRISKKFSGQCIGKVG